MLKSNLKYSIVLIVLFYILSGCNVKQIETNKNKRGKLIDISVEEIKNKIQKKKHLFYNFQKQLAHIVCS